VTASPRRRPSSATGARSHRDGSAGFIGPLAPAACADLRAVQTCRPAREPGRTRGHRPQFDRDIETEEWQQQALCAQTDPESFFPEKGGSVREAKRICAGCEVRAECLEYALAQDERFGIWGGLSERERRPLRRGTTSRQGAEDGDA
jgi:WhiB family redox-sensing transcriptional regulator